MIEAEGGNPDPAPKGRKGWQTPDSKPPKAASFDRGWGGGGVTVELAVRARSSEGVYVKRPRTRAHVSE
jgi:hypothetical protein